MNRPTHLRQQWHIEPQSGLAFTIKQGQTIRITDVAGQQVADLFCFAQDEPEECLSSGHTTDYNGKLFLSTGNVLYSNRSNPMFTIVADDVGRHIMLYAPCSQKMFATSYGITEPHPNCFDNLATHLRPFGLRPSQITTPLNLFMNITFSADGAIAIHPARSKAGDAVTLRAEMDLVVGVTSCAAGTCNNFTWTPIEVALYVNA